MAWWEKLGEGIRVVRASVALTDEALFTIAVGKVLITLLVGEITEVVAASVATVFTKLVSNGAGTDTDLCNTTDIDGYDVGDVIGLTGVPTDNLIPTLQHGSIPGMTTNGIIVPAGTIDLDTEGVATGEVGWTLYYRPIDQGATVVAT